jgi:hypothetical protein
MVARPARPNSYVNDDGKPNLNNSNAEDDDKTRLSVRHEKVSKAVPGKMRSCAKAYVCRVVPRKPLGI